jgi:hypothetical protein
MTKYYHPRGLCVGLALLAAALGTTSLKATTLQFNIDQSVSKLTLSGSILGNPIEEQGPGSLTSSISGRLITFESLDGIQFIGGSVVVANPTGNWKPGPNGTPGSGSAAYGAQAETVIGVIKGALRNMLMDVTSPVLPFGNEVFDASDMVFSFRSDTSPSFDYDAGPLGLSTIPLSLMSTNEIVNGGSLTLSGGLQKLTINIDTQFVLSAVMEGDTIVRLKGQLVAVQADVPTLTSLGVANATVLIRVQEAGQTCALEVSSDLKHWDPQPATRIEDTHGVGLSFPTAGTMQFFRLAK